MIAKSYRLQSIVTAVAAAAFFGLSGSNAAALSLGRVSVKSALGEPLRAEIEVPNINAEEAASLKVSVALPEAFRSAGLDYNPALAGLQAALQKRADGRAFIRLSSDRPVNDPFVDLILEVNWASGRLVRDFTLLLDPPSLHQRTPPAPVEPSLSQSPVQPALGRSASPSRVTTPDLTARQRAAKAPTRPALDKTAIPQARQVNVKPGDTASKIAAANKPVGISLDQMLVALLGSNPDEFIDHNVNRIKAGSVMNIPSAEQAGSTPSAEATQIIVAQSKDFNDFRRKLAGNARPAQVGTADRKTSGQVQAKLEDLKPRPAATDKLTLSKSASPGDLTEDQIAQEQSAKLATKRAAEIAKNISELNQLGASSSTAPPALTASAATPASPIVENASTPRRAAAAIVKLPPAVPQPEPRLIDQLTENPLLPGGAIGLIVLLAGLGFYRSRQRKNTAQLDSSFLDGRVQPDSFFAASGGESVDTNVSPAIGSPSPSQPAAMDAVDPVAEANIYLGYGRDLQAEEILKDALRSNPKRIAIHQKLLEIFAKRRDAHGFGEIATQAFKVTQGEGPDWQRICQLGLSIDPDNAFYQPGGQPTSPTEAPLPPTSEAQTEPNTENIDLLATRLIAPALAGPMDLDLDLDFSTDEKPTKVTPEAKTVDASSPATEPVADLASGPDRDLKSTAEVDLHLEPEPILASKNAVHLPPPVDAIADDKLMLPVTDRDEIKAPAAKPASFDLSPLEFDLGSLSLDLEPQTGAAVPDETEDPLATKLALAQEFHSLGDDEGARVLLEEVIAEASGDMKSKAQNALSSL